MINKISFSGIYDIRFPLGTKSEEIDSKCEKLNSIIAEKYEPIKDSFLVRTIDGFTSTKNKIRPLEEKGIRVISPVDNPHLIFDIFDSISPKLGQDYINQTKVELILDTKA